MSTRSDRAPDRDGGGDVHDAVTDALQQLPDAEALARLANQMFRALPGADAATPQGGGGALPFAPLADGAVRAPSTGAGAWESAQHAAAYPGSTAVVPVLAPPTTAAADPTTELRYPRDGDLRELLALGDESGAAAGIDLAAMTAVPAYYFLDESAAPAAHQPPSPSASAIPSASSWGMPAASSGPAGLAATPAMGSVFGEVPGFAMAMPVGTGPHAALATPAPLPAITSRPGSAMAIPGPMVTMPGMSEVPGPAMAMPSPVAGTSVPGSGTPAPWDATAPGAMPAMPPIPGVGMALPAMPGSAMTMPPLADSLASVSGAPVSAPRVPAAGGITPSMGETARVFGTAPAMPAVPGGRSTPVSPWMPGSTSTPAGAPGSMLGSSALPGTADIPPGMPSDSASVVGMPGFSGATAHRYGMPGWAADPTTVPAMPRVATGAIQPMIVPAGAAGRGVFDPHAIRRDFPILDERVHGKPLVWLDNGATTQKPRAVIDRISRFYERDNSNIHRAAHTLAARSTDAYEAGRESVRRFLNAPSTRNIVFVRGATEGLNLVAQTWGRRFVGEGDEIILTHLEHHSNIVPWQMLCAATGARIKVAPVDDDGQVILDAYERLFTSRTRLVALPHVSNALGTVTPVRAMIEIAHRRGARVVVDGAQAVSHLAVDVQALGCDYYVFSGHKVFGPTGIGAVYGLDSVLDEAPPWQGGGNMIADVTFERTVYQPAPARFEAGTGSIADAVGLGAALDYVMLVGLDRIAVHEHELLEHATRALGSVPGLRVVGTAREKAGVLSFVLDGYRPEEVGAALDLQGIAVRAGHHCAQPILRRFGLESTVRASLALYNLHEEIDVLADALRSLASARRPALR